MAFRFPKADGAPSDSAAPDDRNGDRPRLGRSATRRVALVVAPMLLSLLVALAYLAVAPRTYTGSTSLLIEMPGTGGDAEGTAAVANLDGQVRRIASDAVLRQTVLDEKLANRPAFATAPSGLGAHVLALVGLGHPSASEQDHLAQATVWLASHLVVSASPGNPVVEIKVSAHDPAEAARLSDAVAEAYLRHAQLVRDTLAGEDANAREASLAHLQIALQTAELKLAAYKATPDHGDGAAAPPDRQALADASARLSQAVAHAADLKSRLDEIRRAKAAGLTADALPDVATSPLLDKLRGQLADLTRQQATLRQTLGDRHPAMIAADLQIRDIRRLIGAELGRIQAETESDYRTAQADVTALQGRIQAVRRSAPAPIADPARLDALQRDVDVRKAAYESARRLRVDGEGDVADRAGRIVATSAVPTTPSSPTAIPVLAGALMTGFVLGLLLMVAAETMAPARRGRPVVLPGEEGAFGREMTPVFPDALAREPTVRVLGTVPSPFGNPATLLARDGLLDRLRTAWPTAIEAEHVPTLPGFRTAIHALMLDDLVPAHADGAPRTVLVTSLDSADNRTTFALGLAETAAGQGQRAIVIDADEQGGLLPELVLPSARPILIDLMGTSRICYRVTSPLRGSLSIVPIMAGEAAIVRRLGLRGGAPRIDGLAGNFDLIVFDGPRAGGDSRLDAMAATVDAVIVTAAKSTPSDTMATVIDGLGFPHGTHVSAVRLVDLAEGATTSVAA